MNLRALLPIVCIALLAGCQPKVEPSPEYLEALKDFDAVTVQMVEKEFEIQAAVNDGNKMKAELGLQQMDDIAEKIKRVTDRVASLRPSIPDAKLYADAMKEQEELISKLEGLNIMKKMKTSVLDTIKAEAIATQRKLYDAMERSAVHQPVK